MPSLSRSFSNQIGHIPDACVVDHDSIPRRTPVLRIYCVLSPCRLLFKPIFMVQPTKDSMDHHPEVWGNLMPVRLQRNG
jgi:hypothetical protein